MKRLVLLKFFLLFVIVTYSQNENKPDSISELLHGGYYIEGSSIGSPWELPKESLLWKRAHDLLRHMPIKSVLKCFDTSKHVLKYYSFLKLLDLNDSIAFRKLSDIGNDSTKVFYFSDDSGDYEKFNQLLLSEYKQFSQDKYYTGGVISMRTYYFGPTKRRLPKANSRVWRIKYKEIEEFAQKNNLKPF